MSAPDASEADLVPPRRTGLLAVPMGTEGTVVFDPTSRMRHLLNPSAALVWEHCDGSRDLPELSADVAARFGLATHDVQADVAACLAQLRDRGLIGDAVSSLPPDEPRSASPTGSALAPTWRHLALSRTWEGLTPPLSALGFRFRVATEDPVLASFCERTFASLATPAAARALPPAPTEHLYLVVRRRLGGQERWVVLLDGRAVLRTVRRGAVATWLVWHVNRMAVTSRDDLVVLHAGGVQHTGRTILLPASQNHGKSTLVATLVRAGMSYLSDEAVAIDPRTGLALPYPRAITLDRGSWPVLADLEPPLDHPDGHLTPSWQVPPRLVRPDPIAEARPPSWILFPDRDAEALQPVLTELSPAETLLGLLDSTFPEGLGPSGVEHLANVAREVPAAELRYGEAHEARTTVFEMLGSAPRA